jgi:galactoside O-acetyltransferase
MQPLAGSNPPFLKCGSDVRVFPFARVVGPERITVGSHVLIDDFVFLGAHEQLVIGNYVHIASHASITGGGRCMLCDFAGLSSGVRVLTGSDDFSGAGLTSPVVPPAFRAVTRSRVVIGAHAILGANSVVIPGVTIGEGAAVGAGSIVTRDLAPWAVYAGSPARRVRGRPKERIVELTAELLRLHGLPHERYLSAELLER